MTFMANLVTGCDPYGYDYLDWFPQDAKTSHAGHCSACTQICPASLETQGIGEPERTQCGKWDPHLGLNSAHVFAVDRFWRTVQFVELFFSDPILLCDILGDRAPGSLTR